MKKFYLFSILFLSLNVTATVYGNDFESAIWHFDQKHNDYTYDENNLYTGTLYGPEFVNDGISGSALKFDEICEYVEIEETKITQSTFTIGLWTNFDEIYTPQVIISLKMGRRWNRHLLSLSQEGGIGSFLGRKNTETNFRPEIGRWHHYALTFDNGTLKIYIDGELKITNNVLNETIDKPFILGCNRKLNRFFTGKIDELIIANQTFTAEQIKELAQNPALKEESLKITPDSPDALPLEKPEPETIIPNQETDTNYKYTFDFNGDNINDILLLDNNKNNLYIWLMGTPQDEKLITSISPYTLAKAIPDLNNDGKDDIIFKNQTSGETYVWLMDGINILDEGTIDELSPYYESLPEEVNNFDWNLNYGLLLKKTSSEKIYLWSKNGYNSHTIPLKLNCPGAKHLLLSENQNFLDASWEPYTEDKQFNLSSGDGEKIIYSRFMNSQGELLDGIPTTVVLNKTAPEINLTTPQDNLQTTLPALTIEGSLNKTCFKTFVNQAEAFLIENNYSVGIILNNGQNIIETTAIDLNGNIGSTNPISVYLET